MDERPLWPQGYTKGVRSVQKMFLRYSWAKHSTSNCKRNSCFCTECMKNAESVSLAVGKNTKRQFQRNKRCGACHTVVGDRFWCSLLCLGVPLLVLWLPGMVNFKPAVELLSAGSQQLDVWRRQDQKIRQKKYWQLLQLNFRDVHRFENWRTWKNRERGRICVKVIFKQNHESDRSLKPVVVEKAVLSFRFHQLHHYI